MDLTALIRAFVAAGLLPGLFSEAAPPLGSTHIEPAGTGGAVSPAMIRRLRRVQPASTSDASASAAPRDGGLQDLTAGELAGPVVRQGGANPSGSSSAGSIGLSTYIPSLNDLGLTNPDGSLNVLGILGSALKGASALTGSRGQPAPRAPAVGGGSGGPTSGFPGGFRPVPPVQVPQIPSVLLKALGFNI